MKLNVLGLSKYLLVISVISMPSFSWSADLFVGDRAPNFTLKSNKNENLRLSEQRGQVIFISFWAKWCGTCNQQLKALQGIHNEHQDKGFQVWAISLDEDPMEASFHAQNRGYSFPVLFDKEHKISKTYKIDDLPSVVIVDRDGIIRYVKEEFRSNLVAEYKNQISKLVNE
ncbi:MAG: peroxiredoxin family protein [Pseudomonadales bacterium]|nr:peroxiredoxin family protein [Pseudomonadales bacterium]